MKKTTCLKLTCQMALAVSLFALAGCASHNYEQGADTAAGLTQSANRIVAGEGKIDACLDALTNLVNSSSGDLAPKFDKFNDKVSDLQSSAEDVKSRVAAMRSNGDAYFLAWDQQLAQIKNEDIMSRSTDRKAAVQKQFNGIKQSYSDASAAFKPFLSDLKDIQAALGTDLTPGGIDAVKGAADKANRQGADVKDTLDKLASQFRDLGVSMSASMPATPGQ